MVIKEMESYIVCPKCGYGFKYSALHTHERFETIYKNLFKIHMGKCVHCNESVLTIRESRFKVSKAKKQGYTLRWQCLECRAEWTQINNYAVGGGMSIGQSLEDIKSETVCPLCHAENSSRVLKLSKE